MADNVHFDLTGIPLDLCLKVAFSEHRKAHGWAELPTPPATQPGPRRGERRLVLYWVDPEKSVEGYHPFPAPVDAEAAAPFIRAWLDVVDYGRQPDHDGDNAKGWRVYNESWGHVAGRFQAFVAIEPAWFMYGK